MLKLQRGAIDSRLIGRRAQADGGSHASIARRFMRAAHLPLAAVVVAITGSAAQARVPQPAGAQCDEAIGAAARTSRVPGSLMAAIGLVETGRQDPVSGTWRPWPWTINVEGKGLFFGSKSEAVAAVRTL